MWYVTVKFSHDLGTLSWQLYNSEDLLAQSQIAVTTNLIALYKALGGGWEVAAPRAPVQPNVP